MKLKISTLLLGFFVSVILGLTVRGLPGNLDENSLLSKKYQDDGPLELSPERGRFALTYSIAENKSFEFSLPVARFVTPDLAYQNGRYVSLFAPGVSYLILPGYLIGRIFDASQVGSYAVISFFALGNFFLIRGIAQLLGASTKASTLTSLVFLFATPAFAYAVSLYQHHISVFLILLSIFILLKYTSPLRYGAIWILIGISLVVDYPNAFMMTPIALYMLYESFGVKEKARKYIVNLDLKKICMGICIIIPLLFFFWYNAAAYGNPFQLAGTLRSVDYIDENGKPFTGGIVEGKVINKFEHMEAVGSPNAPSFFNPRNILNGFYIHFLSPDRGILFYAPVILLGIVGIQGVLRHSQKISMLLLSVLGLNILLYSMWGDPWGGWAFGSRYLIPTYALMSIFLAVGFTKTTKKSALLTILVPLFVYSVFVNTLGATTTNKLPPKIQVLQLEEISGREEKYTFERNLDFLLNTGSKSFFYETVAHNFVRPQIFAGTVMSAIIIVTLSIIFNPKVRMKGIKT